MAVSQPTKKQLTKIAKVTGYIAISTAVGGLIALIASNPIVFGIATPFINVLLVTLEQFVKTEQ